MNFTIDASLRVGYPYSRVSCVALASRHVGTGVGVAVCFGLTLESRCRI